MQTVLVVLAVIVSILLILVVLVQKSKGGGLASNFAGSNQIMGVRRTNSFIEKTTWILALILLILSIGSTFFADKKIENGLSKYDVKEVNQPVTTDFATPAIDVKAPEAAADAATAPQAPEAPAAPAAEEK